MIRLRYFEFSSDGIDRIPFSYGKTEFLNLEFLQDRSNFYFFVYIYNADFSYKIFLISNSNRAELFGIFFVVMRITLHGKF